MCVKEKVIENERWERKSDWLMYKREEVSLEIFWEKSQTEQFFGNFYLKLISKTQTKHINFFFNKIYLNCVK